MKSIVLLLSLTLIALTFGACRKDPELRKLCIDPERIRTDVFCTEEYNPVCGCDGITYGNECHANISGVTFFTRGECL